METSYYTPDISEFYVGFEFESSSLDNHWNKLPFTAQKVLGNEKDYFGLYTLSWVEKVFNTPNFPVHLYVRVKHLDRSDIESLGWRYSHTVSNAEPSLYKEDWFIYTINVGSYQMSVTFENVVTISSWLMDKPDSPTQSTRFRGNIRNKSELKKLMQMIGISS